MRPPRTPFEEFQFYAAVAFLTLVFTIVIVKVTIFAYKCEGGYHETNAERMVR